MAIVAIWLLSRTLSFLTTTELRVTGWSRAQVGSPQGPAYEVSYVIENVGRRACLLESVRLEPGPPSGPVLDCARLEKERTSTSVVMGSTGAEVLLGGIALGPRAKVELYAGFVPGDEAAGVTPEDAKDVRLADWMQMQPDAPVHDRLVVTYRILGVRRRVELGIHPR
ncbi:MAG: hypothetical protein ACM3X4_06350 [Ignavibacteriales bacterium]